MIAEIPDRGAPSDGGLLDGAIGKAKQTGMQVRSAYADRGSGTSTADAVLAQHIRDPVIPRQQRAAPTEHTRSWKRRYRFRNSLEGRISQLKRKGLRRTRLPSLQGAQTWIGGITLAHNLQRMTHPPHLIRQPDPQPRRPARRRRSSHNQSAVFQGEVEPIPVGAPSRLRAS